MPVDLIPDAIVGVGYTDDWAVILAALASVATHIKDEHKQRSADILQRFFGRSPNSFE